MARLGTLLLVLLSATWCMAADPAKPSDWHLTADSEHVFAKSAFLHGYMHGYEDGFHAGDLDLHMLRSFQDVLANGKYRKRDVYRPTFGSRHLFEAGYRSGLRVGYSDAFFERPFRAVAAVDQAVSASLPKSENEVPNVYFDDAVATGYKTGQVQGLSDGRSSVAARTLPADCPGAATSRHRPNTCGAFQFGYRIGYQDGYTNQQPHPTLAKK